MTVAPAIAPVSATGVVHGEVITQRWVVEMILDLVGYTPDRDLAALRIIEPSAGTGAFLDAIVDRLLSSVSAHHRDVAVALAGRCISANELQPGNAAALRELVVGKLARAGVPDERASELATAWVSEGDFLLPSPEHETGTADFVVGNPPYIRLEDLGSVKWAEYRAGAPTMRGRADIYIAFFELGLRELKPGGSLGFICADRWMRNDYGKDLRRHITTGGFSVDAIVTLHDAPAFETEVDAYPAVTVISRKPQGPALVADTTSRFDAHSARQLVGFARETADGPVVTETFHAARLTDWHEPGTAG